MNFNKKIKQIQSQKLHPVIFVSGLGGSGKTTFAKKLVAETPNAKLLELDWYLIHNSKERAERIKNVLGPANKNQHLIDKELDPINWYDWESFKKDLERFQKEGKFFVKNAWNQTTGEKDSEHSLDFEGNNGLIVCEGIFMLHPAIRLLADFSILVDLPKVEARKRAEERDKNARSKEHLERKKIIMEKYDVPYFEKYKGNADLILNGSN